MRKNHAVFYLDLFKYTKNTQKMEEIMNLFKKLLQDSQFLQGFMQK